MSDGFASAIQYGQLISCIYSGTRSIKIYQKIGNSWKCEYQAMSTPYRSLASVLYSNDIYCYDRYFHY